MGFASMLGLALTLAAQDPPPRPPTTETRVDDIIVAARRRSEADQTYAASEAYVGEVLAVRRGSRNARWHQPVCISVAGMQPRIAQFMIDRIATRAVDLGLAVGEPGCRANVVIFATSDGPGFTADLVANVDRGFRTTREWKTPDRASFRRFVSTQDPVRWWHVSVPHDLFAMGGSRLRSPIRFDLSLVIVVIDVSKTGQTSLGALSDLVAFVSLAQIDPDANPQEVSIVNLFRSDGTITGLSEWDEAFLQALYASRVDRLTQDQQTSSLVRELIRARTVDREEGSIEPPPP